MTAATAVRRETAAQRAERETAERILRWRDAGPALFAVEALGVPAEWDAEKKEGVMPWQWEASEILVKRKRLSVRSGHRVGKTAFVAWTILWMHCCFFPVKTGCTAPTSTQLSDVLWAELSLWHTRLKLVVPNLGERFEWKSDGFYLKESPQQSFAVARTARAEKPEALQGLHSKHVLIIVDEASGVDEAIFEAGRGSLAAENAYVIFTSNPTRLSGMFYETHHKLRDMWGTIRVNGEEVPLQGQQFRDEIIHQYGHESNAYRIRVTGDFPRAEDDVVIPMELCEAALTRDIQPYGPRIWGLDVARFGDDRNVLIKRCTNATLEKHKSWSGMDTMQTAGKVYAEWLSTVPEERPEMILVDVIGVGGGVCDRLVELGLPALGINVAEVPSVDDKYMRMRDELWFKAREWLESRTCILFKDDALISELIVPGYGFPGSSGKIKVESKDEVKKRLRRSPDIADAFVLTFAYVAEKRGRKSYDPEYYEDF